MAPPVKKNPKPIFKTSVPFSPTTWPETSHDEQNVILDLLCSLLEPLGHHRKIHARPSQGKKRKRKTSNTEDSNMIDAPPPPPELGNHILVGLNSVTRHLEALAASSAPQRLPAANARGHKSFSSMKHATNENEPKEKTPAAVEAASNGLPSKRTFDHSRDQARQAPQNQTKPRALTMIIIPHPAPQNAPAYSHIPTLAHLSTLQSPSDSSGPPPLDPAAATRLVVLPSSSELRLTSALHIPRVGALAILADAPGTKVLLDYVKEKVGVTECKWVDEALRAEWRGLSVTSNRQ